MGWKTTKTGGCWAAASWLASGMTTSEALLPQEELAASEAAVSEAAGCAQRCVAAGTASGPQHSRALAPLWPCSSRTPRMCFVWPSRSWKEAWSSSTDTSVLELSRRCTFTDCAWIREALWMWSLKRSASDGGMRSGKKRPSRVWVGAGWSSSAPSFIGDPWIMRSASRSTVASQSTESSDFTVECSCETSVNFSVARTCASTMPSLTQHTMTRTQAIRISRRTKRCTGSRSPDAPKAE
mmetsp:Transcript_114317/g.357510  ORF Transcript_114317/g.357510 Transcript_114317/m.357510 type:complete len:239 (+) Transcript_114317:483-1199(+)